MDVIRKDAAKKRLIKRIITGLVILAVLVPVGYYVGVPFVFAGKLKPILEKLLAGKGVSSAGK